MSEAHKAKLPHQLNVVIGIISNGVLTWKDIHEYMVFRVNEIRK